MTTTPRPEETIARLYGTDAQIQEGYEIDPVDDDAAIAELMSEVRNWLPDNVGKAA